MSDMSANHCSTDCTLLPLSFADCAGWAEDDQSAAFYAFLQCADYAQSHSYKSGVLGPKFENLLPIFAAARDLASQKYIDRQTARQFFEHYFQPVKIVPHQQKTGFVTGFYEPEIAASRVKTSDYSVPFLSKPADLIKLDEQNRPVSLPATMAFGRKHNGTVSEYFDRQAIDQGALAEQGLEIAYVANKVDAYFAHVQGAVRLNFADGSHIRLTYAAKSGHEFTGAGRVLINKGELEAAIVTMQSIRAWLAAHPERVDEILWHNRSYIFFREALVDDALSGPADNALSGSVDNTHSGPVAAAKVPLTPLRSLAVDRKYHCFGTPFFIKTHDFPKTYGSFQKLMIAQDTGSAILGSARGDLFIGSGEEAGMLAGQIRHEADFIMLVPVKDIGLSLKGLAF